MVLEKEEKLSLINNFGLHDKDTGSSEVQIALLTSRINGLSSHFQSASKDLSSRRGLIALVAKRRKLLNYLKKKQPEKYQALIEKLGLRK
ncbi:MAG TPA: 30S ribosomal protein S15 [Thermodesulfobacteriota bacterium]|jgi:small subunit ribosomal protein S15